MKPYDPINSGQDETEIYLLEKKSVETEQLFMPIRTEWIAIVQFCVIAAYFGSLFISFDTNSSKFFDGYDVLVTIYELIFLGIFLVYLYEQYLHKRARQAGYLQIYIRTRNLIKAPFVIWAFGNVCLVLLVTYVPRSSSLLGLKTINYMQIIQGLITLVILGTTVWYCRIVFLHNYRKPLPDAQKMLEITTTSTMLSGDKNESFKDVLDRQAEMIRYLQEQKAKLSRELNELNDKLNSRGAGPNDDIQHLLASKDQDIRLLQAEIDELKSQRRDESSQKTNGKASAELEEELKKVRAEIEQLNAEKNALRQQQTKLEMMLLMEKETSEEYQEQVKNLENQLRYRQ